jgi:hypothetical protein
MERIHYHKIQITAIYTAFEVDFAPNRSTGLQDETGIRYPLVTGGYKAMRRFLWDEMDHSLEAGNSS